MIKKITKMGVFLVALMAMPIMANAETRFDLKCEKSALNPGETTTCTFYAIMDATEVNAGNGLTDLEMFIETTKNLTIENVTIDSAFNDQSPTDPGLKTASVVLESKDAGGIVEEEIPVLTVEVKLDEAATDECGGICIEATSYELSDSNEVYKGNEACKELELGGENPETGAFTSYLILGGGAVLAIGTMVALKDNKKFHNV